jgi:hypothetical protein
LATLCITINIFCGVVTIVDVGVVDAVVFVDEEVESLVLSFVFCSLLLQDANESNSTPIKVLEIVRAEIIVVVLSIKKCGAEEVIQGVCGIKLQLKLNNNCFLPGFNRGLIIKEMPPPGGHRLPLHMRSLKFLNSCLSTFSE